MDDARHLQVFKLEGRRNKMDFIRGFPGVASRFGIEGIVYEGAPRPEDGEARTEWDRLNKLALEKLRFYVSGRVDRVVTNGDDITARQYYERLDAMFLNIGAESVSSLHTRLAKCKYVEGEEVFSWLARLAEINTQLKTAGAPVPDLEMKHRAMSLISEAHTWGAMAHLLGTGDGVSYAQWQIAMLKKEEELEQNGIMSGQTLADDLYGRKVEGEGAFPATTLHQTFRGSGFQQRGRIGRGISRGGQRMAPQRGFNSAQRGGLYGNHGSATGGMRGGFGNSRGDMHRGRYAQRAGRQLQQEGRGSYVGPNVCYNCGEGGHRAVECYSKGTGYFHGYCNYCGEYGHQQRQCGAQHAHISTDEYERADDGYGYNPSSDYYDTYNQEGQAYNSNAYEYKEEEQPGIFNLMVRVLEPTEDKAMVTAFRSNLDINLDSYCTRHMTPCYELQNQVPCVVSIMVGNKDVLKSTHKGSLRLGKLVFEDVLFVPGLLQTLISEPQLEMKGCRIVSEHGIRTVSRNGKYIFHATLERNSYVFRPERLHTNSRVYSAEEVVLVAKPVPENSANLWHLRLGHLNFSDMCKLRSRSTGLVFEGNICFCETCVLAKMRATPYQNQGHKQMVAPKQNICYDVSGPFTPTADMSTRLMRSANDLGRGGGAGVNLSRSQQFF